MKNCVYFRSFFKQGTIQLFWQNTSFLLMKPLGRQRLQGIRENDELIMPRKNTLYTWNHWKSSNSLKSNGIFQVTGSFPLLCILRHRVGIPPNLHSYTGTGISDQCHADSMKENSMKRNVSLLQTLWYKNTLKIAKSLLTPTILSKISFKN